MLKSSELLNTKHILSHYDPAVLQMIEALKLAEKSGAAAEVVDAIKSALNLVEQRESFTEGCTSQESEPCKKIMDSTYSTDWKKLKEEEKTSWQMKPVMVTGHLAGQFLKSLVSMQKAKRILEIGMFTGYSALVMAEALPADGEVVTVDKEEYLESHTGALFKQSPHGNKIKIHIGDAIDYMKKAAENKEIFDIIFLDADKSQYVDYLKIAMDGGLLSPGGSILVDNAFRHGDGYMDETKQNPTKTFAQAIKADASLHSVLVPLRDGIVMVRRMADVEGATS